MSQESGDQLREQVKRLTAELAQSKDQFARQPLQQNLSEAFSDILHELNQPLSSISNFAFVANRLLSRLELADSESVDLRNCMEMISDQVQRVTTMMQQLRLLGRSSSSEQPIHLDQVVAQVLQNAEAMMGPLTDQVEVSFPAQLPAVMGDSLQIEYLLTSLITVTCPAADSSAGDWSLKITAEQVSNALEVTITLADPNLSDDGKLFAAHRFELAVSRWIVQSNGGELRHVVQETAQGFLFSLPLYGKANE